MRPILKRWYFWLILFIALPVFFASIGLIYSGQGPINQANFDRIHGGLREPELRAILGETTLDFDVGEKQHSLVWIDAPGAITVVVDDQGKVSHKSFSPRSFSKQIRWLVNSWREKLGMMED